MRNAHMDMANKRTDMIEGNKNSGTISYDNENQKRICKAQEKKPFADFKCDF